MATTYTPNLLIANPAPFDPAVTNAWGTILNTDRTLMDSAVGGVLPLTGLTGGTVILTSNAGAADQARNAHFVLTGVLTSPLVLLWPQSCGRMFSVQNNTTGSFSVTVGANNGSGSAAGTTQTVTQGTSNEFASDGTNITPRITASTGGQIHVTSFFFGSTFTTPTGTSTSTVYLYKLWGAGGGGGATNAPGTGGGGGGAGAYVEGTFTGVAAATAITVTIGAGGTAGTAGGNGGNGGASSIGTPVSVSCGGGFGGHGDSGVGGAGGAPSGAGPYLSLTGGSGSTGIVDLSNTVAYGSDGANSTLGGGGVGMLNANGGDAKAFGAGGGGGGNNGGLSTTNGGAGGGGFFVIQWIQ